MPGGRCRPQRAVSMSSTPPACARTLWSRGRSFRASRTTCAGPGRGPPRRTPCRRQGSTRSRRPRTRAARSSSCWGMAGPRGITMKAVPAGVPTEPMSTATKSSVAPITRTRSTSIRGAPNEHPIIVRATAMRRPTRTRTIARPPSCDDGPHRSLAKHTRSGSQRSHGDRAVAPAPTSVWGESTTRSS